MIVTSRSIIIVFAASCILFGLGVIAGGYTTARDIDLKASVRAIDSLNIEILKLGIDIDNYKQITDSLSYELAAADSSSVELKRKYDDKKTVITSLSSDSLVSILSERYGVFSFTPY